MVEHTEDEMDAAGPGSTAEGSALRLVDEFAAFGPCCLKWVRSQLQDCGLTYADLGVTRRNVTALVDALEGEGLVRRRPHPTDRRPTIIELTSEGAETTDSMYNSHREAVAGVFADLSENERHELIRLLGSLHETLRDEGLSC